MNISTACSSFADESVSCFHFASVPFYYSHKPSLFASFPDKYLALASPIIAYWSLSLFFHSLDVSGWKWLDKYRIHESAEVKARNVVTRSHVVMLVLLQQGIQTLLGYMWLSDDFRAKNHIQNMQDIAVKLQPLLRWITGTNTEEVLPDFVYLVYWWGIPCFQFFAAMYVNQISALHCDLTTFMSLGSLLTHGSTSYIDWRMLTNSCINISTPGITVSTFPTHSGHYTIILWKVSS